MATEMKSKAESMNMHGLPTAVATMLESLPNGVCGRCTSFDAEAGMCQDRGLQVGPRDVSCVLFVGRPS